MDDSVSASIRDSLSGQASLLTQLAALSIEPRLLQEGISMSTFDLLSAVRSAGEANTQAEIARRLGIRPASLSEAVRQATRAGLLDQTPSESDGRAKRLTLTAKGRRTLGSVLKEVNRAEQILVEGIDLVALRTAIAVLQTANKNLARVLNAS